MLRVRENRGEINRRIDAARLAVGAVFALLATGYWYIQIVRGDHYYALSENNRIRSVRIPAPRGYVLDRRGSILVDNEPGYTLHLYRREAKDLAAARVANRELMARVMSDTTVMLIVLPPSRVRRDTGALRSRFQSPRCRSSRISMPRFTAANRRN